MAKPLKLSLEFSPEIDQAKLEKLRKVLTDAIETGTEIDFNEPAIKQALSDINKMIETAIDEVDVSLNTDELDADTKKAIDSLNDISEEYEKLKNDTVSAFEAQKKLVNELDKQGKVNTPEYNQAVKEANDLHDVLKKIEQSEDGVTTGAEGITDGLGDATEQSVKFIAAMEGLGAISEMFGGLVEKGEEYNKMSRQLQASTGASAEEMKVLEKAANDAYVNGVGESASQALEIVGQAKKSIGKVFTGDELAEATIAFDHTAKAMGKEFEEVASRAAGFAKTFGLSGKESAELVTFAMQKGTTASDDVLDTLAEFSPHLKDAGFSAQEFVGILEQAGEAGAFSTALIGDAVKETGIRLKSGDIKTELSGLITDMGDRFPEALQKTLNNVADLAQKGQLSTKEAMEQSAKAIEDQFKNGSIDKLMRGKLQSAFAGGPAEEIGSETYAKIFGAPIDEDLIKAKAAAANATLQAAMGTSTLADKFSKQFDVISEKAASAILPLTKGIAGVTKAAPSLLAIKQFLPESAVSAISGKFKELPGIIGKMKGALGGGAALMNPYVLGGVAAGAAFAYFFTQTERGKNMLAVFEKKWDDFYAKAKPVLEAVGGLLSVLVEGVIGNIVTEFEVMGDIVGEVFSVLFDLGKELISFLGLTSGGGDESSSTFTDMADAINKVGVIVSSVFAGIQAAMRGFAEVIKKLIHLDFSGALEEAEKIGPGIAAAMKSSAEKELKNLKIEGLQKSIASGLEIKGSLDKNGEIQKLIDSYKNATDEVTKQNLAAEIAKQVPGAINSMTAVVDEATGKTTEVYDIAIDKAEKFVGDQGTILNKQVDASKKAFVDLLQDQVSGLEESKKKLSELASKTVSAKTPEEQAAALKAYDEEKKKIEEQSKAIAGTVAQGKGLGISADHLEAMAENAGLSSEASKKLAGTMKEVEKQTKLAKLEASALAKAYNDAQSNAANIQALNTQAATQAALNIKQAQNDLRTKKGLTEDEKKDLKETIELNKTALKESAAKAKSAVKEQEQSAEQMERIKLKTGELKRVGLEAAQAEISRKSTTLDFDLQAYQVMQNMQILDQKRERSSFDDLTFAQKELDVANEKIRITAEQLIIGGKTKEQQAEVLEAVRAQIREIGKIDFDSLSPDIKLKVAEDSFGDGKQAIKEQLTALLVDAENKGLNIMTMKAQLAPLDISEIANLQHDLEKRKLEFDISIGIKDDRSMAQFLGNDLELAQKKLEDGEKKLSDLRTALGNAQSDAAKATLQGQVNAQVTANLQQENAVLDIQQTIDDSWRAFYDEQAALAQKGADRELEAQTRLFDNRSALIERSLVLENQLIVAGAEKRNAELNALLDENAAERSKRIDDAANDELKQLDEIQKVGILSELDYISQKAEIEATAEQARKDEADRIAKEKEDAERKHQQELTRIASAETGKRLLLETEKLKRELTAQKKSLNEQYRIAKEKSELPSATKADKDAAQQLSTQLADIETALIEKGDVVAVLAGEVGGTLQDAIGGMFEGNEEQMADSFRKLFSMVAGALKQLASSFILDIILQSPFIKSAIAINPFLGAAITATATGVIRGLTNALLSPVLDGLLSFSSGGAVNSPTLAIIGDAAKLGGQNKEWIMRDEHIWKIAYGAGQAATQGLSSKMDRLINAVENMGGEWRLKGQDLVTAFKRAEAARTDRLM